MPFPAAYHADFTDQWLLRIQPQLGADIFSRNTGIESPHIDSSGYRHHLLLTHSVELSHDFTDGFATGENSLWEIRIKPIGGEMIFHWNGDVPTADDGNTKQLTDKRYQPTVDGTVGVQNIRLPVFYQTV